MSIKFGFTMVDV